MKKILLQQYLLYVLNILFFSLSGMGGGPPGSREIIPGAMYASLPPRGCLLSQINFIGLQEAKGDDQDVIRCVPFECRRDIIPLLPGLALYKYDDRVVGLDLEGVCNLFGYMPVKVPHKDLAVLIKAIERAGKKLDRYHEEPFTVKGLRQAFRAETTSSCFDPIDYNVMSSLIASAINLDAEREIVVKALCQLYAEGWRLPEGLFTFAVATRDILANNMDCDAERMVAQELPLLYSNQAVSLQSVYTGTLCTDGEWRVPIKASALSQDRHHLAAVNEAGEIILCDMDPDSMQQLSKVDHFPVMNYLEAARERDLTDEEKAKAETFFNRQIPSEVVWVNNGGYLVCCSKGRITVWKRNGNSLDKVHDECCEDNVAITSIIAHPHEPYVFIGMDDGFMYLYDLRDAKQGLAHAQKAEEGIEKHLHEQTTCYGRIIERESSPVSCFAWNNVGTQLVVIHQNGHMVLYEHTEGAFSCVQSCYITRRMLDSRPAYNFNPVTRTVEERSRYTASSAVWRSDNSSIIVVFSTWAGDSTVVEWNFTTGKVTEAFEWPLYHSHLTIIQDTAGRDILINSGEDLRPCSDRTTAVMQPYNISEEGCLDKGGRMNVSGSKYDATRGIGSDVCGRLLYSVRNRVIALQELPRAQTRGQYLFLLLFSRMLCEQANNGLTKEVLKVARALFTDVQSENGVFETFDTATQLLLHRKLRTILDSSA